HIGEHVLAVGDQGEGNVAAARAHQIEAEGKIDEGGAEDDQEPESDLTDVGPCHQAAHRLVNDEDGGKGDEAPLEGRREELDLPVPVRVIAIGGAAGEQQAAQSEYGGEHVD